MLQTERLFLRNFCTADADLMFDYRNDARCNLYQRYGDTSRSYLQVFVRDYANSSFLSQEAEQHYAIARIADGTLVGDLSLFFSGQDNCFTIGITIAPAFQRLGYAYEFLHAFIACLQAEYPSLDIVALIEKENTKSISLFQKLGFYEECYAESIQSYVFTIFGKTSF